MEFNVSIKRPNSLQNPKPITIKLTKVCITASTETANDMLAKSSSFHCYSICMEQALFRYPGEETTKSTDTYEPISHIIYKFIAINHEQPPYNEYIQKDVVLLCIKFIGFRMETIILNSDETNNISIYSILFYNKLNHKC